MFSLPAEVSKRISELALERGKSASEVVADGVRALESSDR